MEYPVSFYELAYGIDELEKPSIVMLDIGAPGAGELQNVASYMKEAMLHRFNKIERRTVQSIQYGPNNGDPYLIDQLHKFLSEHYSNSVAREDLFITNGASVGVWDIFTRFFRPGDTIFVEDPTYKAIVPALQSSEFNIVAINMDEDGMIVTELETRLRNLQLKPICDRYPFKAAVYTIPICHNPTTRTMTPERQKKLIGVARKFDLLLISDDVYNLLWYADSETDDPSIAKPPRTLYSNDCKSDNDYKGNVISVGSFSKFIGPGFRLGWYEMPTKWQPIFCGSYAVDSGAGKNPFLGGMLAAAFELSLMKKHLHDVKALYAKRMRAVHEIIMKSLRKLGVHCHLPNAGYFLWVTLPDTVTAEEVLELSKNEVTAFRGDKCSLSGSYKNCLRVSVTFYEEKVLYPAVEKLCEFIAQAITKA